MPQAQIRTIVTAYRRTTPSRVIRWETPAPMRMLPSTIAAVNRTVRTREAQNVGSVRICTYCARPTAS